MAEKDYLGLEAHLRAAADEEDIEEQAEEAVDDGHEHDAAYPRLGLSLGSAADQSFRTPQTAGTQIWQFFRSDYYTKYYTRRRALASRTDSDQRPTY